MFLNRLYAAVDVHSERPAFCIQGVEHTYAAFASRVSDIQCTVAEQFADSKRIGVVLGDDLDTYAAVVALLLLGRAYVPLHPAHPADRIAQIVAQAGVNVILTSEPFGGAANAVVVPTGSIPSGAAELMVADEALGEREAYVLFTSGSTGVPKGTPITYGNVEAFVTAFDALGYDITEQDRFLQMFDLTFDLSVMSYLIPLCYGACVCTVPEKGMKYMSVYGVLEEQQLSFALMVPSIISLLRPYFDEIRLPAMKYSLFCGEALHADVAAGWAACVPNAVIDNVYGPTEATIFCMSYRYDATKTVIQSNGILSIGVPMHGNGVMIADEAGEAVAAGEKGELCLSGPQVTPGYLDKQKNEVAFFMHGGQRWYRTGDIACVGESGNYIYCGRLDQQVKIQGFRVELGEVEHHVRSLYGCNVVALIRENAQGMSQIEVVIEGADRDKDLVKAALKERLPYYMLPAEIHFISPFPLNVNGKTDRKSITAIIAAL